MGWRKSLMMILVFLTAVMVNVDYSFATEGYNEAIPANKDIELDYEGNGRGASYGYYRITVKYPNADSKIRETPESLVIYEKNLETQKEEVVHQVNFGENGGKPLKQSTDKSFLNQHDAFYYRNFTVEKQQKGISYEYRCEVYFKASKDSEGEAITRKGNNTVTVNVTKDIDTEEIVIGTKNMFSRQVANVGFDIDSPYLPEAYSEYKDNKNRQWKYGYEKTNEIYEANNMLDIDWSNNNQYINVIQAGNSDHEKFKDMFISNVGLEIHALYTGTQLKDDESIRFSIEGDALTGDSKEIAHIKEVPSMSAQLTSLARAERKVSDYPESARPSAFENNVDAWNFKKGEADKTDINGMKIYPKKRMHVYMGMGSGAQGSLAQGDNENDVSYLFATQQGQISPQFRIHVEKVNSDGKQEPAVGFVFDYISIKYNPFLLGSVEAGEGDGFVKPSGYMMLNSNFKVSGNIPRPEMTINMDEVLKTGGALEGLINFDETKIKLYIAREGENFKESDLCDIAWNGGPTATPRIMNVIIPPTHLTTKSDPEDETKEIVYLKDGDYKIKMHIPTSLGSSYSTAAYQVLLTENRVFPIQLKVIMDDPMFEDRPELQVRVDKTFKITPYKMPGIN